MGLDLFRKCTGKFHGSKVVGKTFGAVSDPVTSQTVCAHQNVEMGGDRMVLPLDMCEGDLTLHGVRKRWTVVAGEVAVHQDKQGELVDEVIRVRPSGEDGWLGTVKHGYELFEVEVGLLARVSRAIAM